MMFSVRVGHSRHCEETLRAGAGLGRLYVRPLAHELRMYALSRAITVVVNQRTPHAYDAAHVSLEVAPLATVHFEGGD